MILQRENGEEADYNFEQILDYVFGRYYHATHQGEKCTDYGCCWHCTSIHTAYMDIVTEFPFDKNRTTK